MVSRSKILSGIQEQYTSNVIPTCAVMSINNAIFKSQPSTPMQAFASMRSTLFMEIDDKGGEVGTKICQYTKREV
jgi:hypothetical protein